jgi:hypothetical protein
MGEGEGSLECCSNVVCVCVGGGVQGEEGKG